MAFFRQELAIDLGTANTVIFGDGQVVLDEPGIIAVEPDRICFRESLLYYVNLIAESEREVCDCNNDLIDKKEFEESYLNWVDKDALSRKRPS